MLQFFTVSVLIFFLVNLVNVVLGTFRSLTTIKSSKLVASVTNAVSYGFYAGIIKLISDYPMDIVVIITVVSNLIGVYTSIWLFDKMKKDRLWKVTIVCTEKDAFSITGDLHYDGIGYYTKALEGGQFEIEITAFSKNQTQSELIKESVIGTHAKYHIVELNKSL